MRGSQPGERRGGRQIGTPNKRTTDVRERLEELGCDPIEGMAAIAMDDRAPMELRGRMYAELACYVAPKRRAIEHTGENGGPIIMGPMVDRPPSETREEWIERTTRERARKAASGPV